MKWTSNSPEVISMFPEENVSLWTNAGLFLGSIATRGSNGFTVRPGGWCPCHESKGQDYTTYKMWYPAKDSLQFWPFGIFVGCIAWRMLIFQDLCSCPNLVWDDPIPEKYVKRWESGWIVWFTFNMLQSNAGLQVLRKSQKLSYASFTMRPFVRTEQLSIFKTSLVTMSLSVWERTYLERNIFWLFHLRNLLQLSLVWSYPY